ncbi:hypothetical protein [Actinomycetospora sp. TBRC 11914]|uniref:hypothetical protein n=1 Tax=Actinomycetospora sp. TBRC 11914 TaxID=2729387 RepID=UPI00145E6107|nr:hypothetical protein [Actinomycetospora sp. TBRC 11914]NMO92963.1 hypothetical protein [Actinomycetospora sp. TBRC 11914]
MAGVTAGQLVTVLVIVIFLIIVFWRIAIPLLAAFVLAKVVVAVMGTMAAIHGTAGPTAAVFLPLLL